MANIAEIERQISITVDPSRSRRGLLAIQRGLEGVDGAALRAQRGFGRLTGGIEKARASVFSLQTAAAAFGASFLLRDAIRTIGEFERALSGVRAVTQANTVEMEFLEEQARQLGATTVFSAREAASGMEFLGRAGFEVSEILQTMPAMLDLAAAGQLDLGRAADIASNLLSAFRLEASEANQVVDVLATTAASANTDVNQLAEALKFAGPIAGSLGRDIEELAVIIGALGNQGIQASLAGTGIRRTLLSLAAPTQKAREEIEALNLDLADLNPVTNDLVDIIRRLSDAEIGAAEASEIFQDRGATAILALAGAGEDLETLEEAMRNTDGRAREMAQIMQDNLANALVALRSAVEELFLATGDAGLGGALRGLVDAATDTVRALAGMDDGFIGTAERAKMLADRVELLGAALAGLGAARLTRTLAPAFVEIALGLGEVALAAGRLVALPLVSVLRGTGTAAAGAAGAFRVLGTALRANIWGLVATAIGVATFELIRHRDTVVRVGEETGTIVEQVRAAWAAVAEVVVTAWESVEATFGTLADVLEPVLAFIAEGFGTLFGTLLSLVRDFVNAVSGLFWGIAGTIEQVVVFSTGRWDDLRFLGDVWSEAFGTDYVQNALDGARDAADGFVEIWNEKLREIRFEDTAERLREESNRLLRLREAGIAPGAAGGAMSSAVEAREEAERALAEFWATARPALEAGEITTDQFSVLLEARQAKIRETTTALEELRQAARSASEATGGAGDEILKEARKQANEELKVLTDQFAALRSQADALRAEIGGPSELGRQVMENVPERVSGEFEPRVSGLVEDIEAQERIVADLERQRELIDEIRQAREASVPPAAQIAAYQEEVNELLEAGLVTQEEATAALVAKRQELGLLEADLARRAREALEGQLGPQERRLRMEENLNELLAAGLITQEEMNALLAEQDEIIRGTNEHLSAQEQLWDGVALGAEQYRQRVSSVREAAFEVQRVFQGVEDQIVSAFMNGRFAAEEFFQSIIGMIGELVARQLVAQPIVSTISAGLSALAGSAPVPAGRAGGTVGNLPETELHPLLAWANAPSMAIGGMTSGLRRSLAGGGIPIVAHDQEAVVPLDAGRIPVDILNGQASVPLPGGRRIPAAVDPGGSASGGARPMRATAGGAGGGVTIQNVTVVVPGVTNPEGFIRRRGQIASAIQSATRG